MKQLLAGVALLFVVGFGAFLYRNTMERPGITAPVCTAEARLCPDGSSVGRDGPTCAFAPCAYPNVEIAEAGIAFAVPPEYAADERVFAGDPHRIAAFTKPSSSSTPQHTIVVRRYPIAEEETADDVILAHTRYQPADEPAADFSRFSPLSIHGTAFRETVIERFEALVHSSYFLSRETDVLRFDIIEHDVMGWMEPNLNTRELPEHAALLRMLETLERTP